MTPSPRERLAVALDAIGDIARYAVIAGVSPRQFANAQSARPCSTVAFLRICVAVRHDPLPILPHKMPFKPSDFDFEFFSIGFRMKRIERGENDRQAAVALGFSPATVCRIEKPDAMQIGVILRACEYIGCHPFGYLAIDPPIVAHLQNANVSRGKQATSTG